MPYITLLSGSRDYITRKVLTASARPLLEGDNPFAFYLLVPHSSQFFSFIHLLSHEPLEEVRVLKSILLRD